MATEGINWNKIQLNGSEETDGQGRIIRKTMLIVIRDDSVQSAIRNYNQVKAKLSEPPEDNMNMPPENGNILLNGIKFEQVDEEKCPRCGGKLVERQGRHGAFMACSNYRLIGCAFTKKLERVY